MLNSEQIQIISRAAEKTGMTMMIETNANRNSYPYLHIPGIELNLPRFMQELMSQNKTVTDILTSQGFDDVQLAIRSQYHFRTCEVSS